MPAKDFFESLPAKADPERLAGIDNSYLFDITGEGRWLVVVRDGKVTVTEGWEGDADVTFTTSAETFEGITVRRQNPMMAFMTGKLKMSGDTRAAMALQNLL